MSLTAAFIYSDLYYVNLGEHVFPVEKYRLVYERLLHEGFITPENTFFPSLAEPEDLLLVHTANYLKDLDNLSPSSSTMFSELPLTREIVQGYRLYAEGCILVADKAMERGIAIHRGGGFHHAFPSRGEGFCYINDVAISIKKHKKLSRFEKVLIVDCDLHQGNGNAFIFKKDRSVFTFSIHQEDLYPIKQESDLDIGLADFAGDDVYLHLLEEALRDIKKKFSPEIVYYLAGADPYREDQLGNLTLTKEGLMERDRLVIGSYVKRSIPLVILLAGGYAVKVEDTVEIHCNTCRIATACSR
ncbi:histone deacetylase [Candidatus Aerophobetes bacterium]|uniref:Histone deacetylase n=1 Tax=Aerophobetes bacterium TaxID=2030807 RepID=A0A523QKK5_UNCAE|nr:MAG: histone deacetylase [Candidatus Aerophobetes bacterium]